MRADSRALAGASLAQARSADQTGRRTEPPSRVTSSRDLPLSGDYNGPPPRRAGALQRRLREHSDGLHIGLLTSGFRVAVPRRTAAILCRRSTRRPTRRPHSQAACMTSGGYLGAVEQMGQLDRRVLLAGIPGHAPAGDQRVEGGAAGSARRRRRGSFLVSVSTTGVVRSGGMVHPLGGRRWSGSGFSVCVWNLLPGCPRACLGCGPC
jgi:hypothetical protein